MTTTGFRSRIDAGPADVPLSVDRWAAILLQRLSPSANSQRFLSFTSGSEEQVAAGDAPTTSLSLSPKGRASKMRVDLAQVSIRQVQAVNLLAGSSRQTVSKWIVSQLNRVEDFRMTRLVEIPVGNSILFVETSESVEGRAVGASAADRATKQVKQSLEDSLEVLGDVGQAISRVLDKTTAQSAEVSLGLKFTAKGTLFVAETSAEATISFKLSYARQK
jgi:hypothetical protein